MDEQQYQQHEISTTLIILHTIIRSICFDICICYVCIRINLEIGLLIACMSTLFHVAAIFCCHQFFHHNPVNIRFRGPEMWSGRWTKINWAKTAHRIHTNTLILCRCAPSPPFDNIWSYGDCLEVKREYYLNCFILATCYLFNGHS